MRVVKTICISGRDGFPHFLKVGKEYWVDLDSIYKDKDDSIYVRVYEDVYKQKEVGIASLSHFSCYSLYSKINNV